MASPESQPGGHWFTRLSAVFLPDQRHLGEEQRERAALVAGVCTSLTLVLLPISVASVLVYRGLNVVGFGAVLAAAAMVLIGLLQRTTGRVQLAGALVPIVGLLVLASVGLRQGGLDAINVMCYPFVPLAAGFLVGRRGAVAATLGVTALLLAFLAMHQTDYVFPVVYVGEQRHLLTTVGAAFTAAFVMSVTILYEQARSKARRVTAENLSELRRNALELEEARGRAEAAAKTKGEFLARVSHELRTPLNGVLGMTELLLGSGLSSEQRDFARDSRRSAKALLALVNDLLDFSKLESGTVDLLRTGLDPRLPAEDAVGVLAGAAQRKGLELVLHIHPDVPRWVQGDPDRLRQVLLNLVGNGVKYTQGGSVVVTVRRMGDGGPICWEVDDTGMGLPGGSLDRLFVPFSQADPEANRRLGGVGLGLAICRELVQRMGGTIGAKRRDVGSHFYFTLPVVEPDEEQPSRPLVPLHGRRIIVVDDSSAAAEATAAVFAGQGAETSTCRTVDGALLLLRTDGADLVIADTVMPDADARALLKSMAAEPGLSEVPVILTVPYGLSIDLSGLSGMRTGRVRKPCFEGPLLGAAAGLLGLPRPAPSADARLVEVSGAGVPGIDGGGARVLVVDDNDVGRRLARELLSRIGFSVDEARDGREAVEKALAEDFAVILMDCRMPELDGYEATRLIREAQKEHRPAIVAVTAHALDDERERCLAAGMDDYLTKPFRPSDLARTVLAWLKPPAS